MAPDRSTTRAGTESAVDKPVVTKSGRRKLALTLAAVAVIAVAAVLLRPDAPERSSAPQTAEGPSLIVGDGRSVTLLSLGGPATDALLDRVAAEIGAATARVEDFWGTDWSREITVVATDSPAQFAAAAPAAPAGMAAVAVADNVDLDRRSATGQRIVLGPGARRMSDAALRIVLVHELFHYAARADTAADAPRWLTEGVADYIARPAPDAGTSVALPSALPADADFDRPEPELSQAYDRAWLFARFLAHRHGAPALRELYRRAAGPDRVPAEVALREITGTEPGPLLRQWRQWSAGPR